MRIKRILLFILALQFLWLNSCIDEYWPDVDKYENLLVVEGGITNTPGPYTIKISKSLPVKYARYIPFSGCVLKIFDDDGSSETLVETEPGTYSTMSNGIQGQIGKRYKLSVITPQGKEYESSYEELIKPVLIDDVYAEVEYHSNSGLDHPQVGYQFYIDAEETLNDTNFYLWDMEATFHFQSDFFIRWYYNGRVREFHPIDSLYDCWRTNKVKDIFTFNSTSLVTNKLERFPLNYVNTETKELTVKYSLLVNQHTIGKSAYQYWNAIEEQNSEQGSMYSQQPYQIRGNMRSINDDNESVLGYFMVSGFDTRRIFVDRIDAPFYFTRCSINDGNYQAYAEIGATLPYLYPVYIILYDEMRAVPGQSCADCRQNGGTITKPDFWED